MDKPKLNLPEWLKQTQNNSWEPEVFISGIVLFGLIQLPERLESLRFFFIREVYSNGNEIDSLVAVLMTSIQWLIFGLILHLFFRGIWIGLVGLSYVFPKGIKNENLNFKGTFKNRVMTIPNFTDQIILLEKISSSIFSISYFIFMSILGAYFFVMITLVAPVYFFNTITGIDFSEYENNPIYDTITSAYAIFILVIGALHLFDFLTLGLLKKNRYIAKFYYPFYLIVSTLTLSPLYRNIYYILISNFKKWKVITFIVCFIIITFNAIEVNSSKTPLTRQFTQLEMYGSTSQNSIQTDAYANLGQDPKFHRASIQSDIVKDDVLRLFITHTINYEDSIKTLCDYNLKLRSRSKRDSLKLACMKEFYRISVDDSLYTDIQWFFHYNSSTAHRGIISYLDISNLKRGMHHIDIDLKNWRRRKYDIVQFYKE